MVLDIFAIAFTIGLAIAMSLPLGRYMARVFLDRPTWLDRALVPVERAALRAAGAHAAEEQDWRAYARSLLVSNACMWVVALAVLVLQGVLPLNPDGIAGMGPTLAFHTAVSFVTNTNLQHYSGEAGLSYLSQMMMTWLQFVSAATGIAAFVAIVRGLGGSRIATLGNFHADLMRAAVRILLPFAVALALLFAWQGVPSTFAGAVQVETVEGDVQVIARGPVAAMVAIKQLGTNGGGFFGPNSSHPFENPTPLTNLASILAILLIPMGLIWTSGEMLERRGFARMIFATMLALYIPLLVVIVRAETAPPAAVLGVGADAAQGSMEGKEVRHGAALTGLWAVSTTITSNGSVNGMHDSLTPTGGLVALSGMWLNNIFGGVGVGFINMFVFIVVTTFLAGMMTGHAPALLGKKLEAREMRLASMVLLLHPLLILGGSALACWVWTSAPAAADTLGWLGNPGARGFSEIVYEFSSAAANNGSGFEGLGDDTAFWNIATGLVMLLGRYVPIVAPLALAGALGERPTAEETPGSLRTDTVTFAAALWSVVLVLGLLMFLPVAMLGPIAEALTQAA